jgi:type I restriction enzyme M protein
VLTPGRYVGAAEVENDAVPFADRFASLTTRLQEQFSQSEGLTRVILEKLARVRGDV